MGNNPVRDTDAKTIIWLRRIAILETRNLVCSAALLNIMEQIVLEVDSFQLYLFKL